MKPLSRTSAFDPLPLLALVVSGMVVVMLGMIFFYAPIERSMGVVQKIFYIHVPSAIAGYIGFLICAAASIIYLLRRTPAADVVARAGAECGVLFCTAVLLSGPLWARKAWGVWWTGEPRLLLTLVLMLIFVAYLLVRSLGGRSELTSRICAMLAILGVANIPMVRWSVERWRGSHPQVMTGEGGGISSEMELVLTISFATIGLLFALLFWLRVRIGLAEEDVERFHREASARAYRIEDRSRGNS